ncbi:MAG: hypothetical protein ACLTRS_02785 [Lachnospiraceae bacterium]
MTGIRKRQNGVTNQEGKKSMALQFISGNSIIGPHGGNVRDNLRTIMQTPR